MIRIALRPRHAHLDEFARHICADEVVAGDVAVEDVEEGRGGGLRDGDGAEGPEGEDKGFVGLEC